MQDPNALLRQVRRIEIKTRRCVAHIQQGNTKTTFKGRGMSFAEVREYQYGDDVRDIDWNVTAKYGVCNTHNPYVKLYEEEKQRTLMLLVDVSGSLHFGSRVRQKRELLTEIAATLAFSAMRNDDNIGVIFFTDRVERVIRAGKGRRHILRIIHELLLFEPKGVGTDLNIPLVHLRRMMKRRCNAFLLSDMLAKESYKNSLLLCNKRHDLTAIQIYDPLLAELPDVGLLAVQDTETGERKWIDTSSPKVRRQQHSWVSAAHQTNRLLFKEAGIDLLSIRTDEDYVRALINLFNRRR